MEYSSFERTRKRKEQKPVVVAAASDAVEAAKRAKSVVVAAAGAPMVSELDQRKWYEEAADELVTMDRSIWKWVVDVVVVVGSSTDSAISESIVLLVRR